MSNEAVNQQQTLLVNLLKAISHNGDIYVILQENLDKLNEDFALLLRTWSTRQFAQQEPAKAINLAKIIFKFSKLIQSFEQGDSASNLEIAIAGYETSLQVYNREAYPNDWYLIHEALLGAYQQRQKRVYTIINELKQELDNTRLHVNTLSENIPRELQQSQSGFDELKTAITQLKQETLSNCSSPELTSLINEVQNLKERLFLLDATANNSTANTINYHFNTAIFYDIENLTMGRSNPNFNFSLKQIQEKILTINPANKISIQCAYADWSDSRFKILKNEIQELGIEAVQIFDFGYKKNAADIQLAIDVIELAHNRPTLQVFVIISGDGAFASLVKKLHEYGKTVIVCAYDGQSNRFLKSVCDAFIPISLPQESIELIINNDDTWNYQENSHTRDNIFDLTRQILLNLRRNPHFKNETLENGVVLSKIHILLKQEISNFDQRRQLEWQNPKLSSFLEEALKGTDICLSSDNNKLIFPLNLHVQKKS